MKISKPPLVCAGKRQLLPDCAHKKKGKIKMNDPETTEVAANAVVGLVNMFKDAKLLFWIITLYSLIVGAAMTYFGEKHLKKLLFFVGAFTVYLPMSYFASMMTTLIVAVVTGIVMAFLYPVFVFFIGGTALCSICLAIGMGETVAGLLGVAAGVAAVIYRKHITIPITAYSGASMLVIGLAFLFVGLFMVGMHMAVVYVLLVLFFGSGMFVQYKYTGKDPVVPAGETNDAAEAK